MRYYASTNKVIANSIHSTQGYKKVHPLFVPKLLINLGAGHISMKYGFMVSTYLFPVIATGSLSLFY